MIEAALTANFSAYRALEGETGEGGVFTPCRRVRDRFRVVHSDPGLKDRWVAVTTVSSDVRLERAFFLLSSSGNEP